ncbi:hypothetical protein AVEN_211666-1 [Araneus ventricosus]|nr:hypothetical protein AVEN_171931-1 [Araneus ventricosus]GBN46354.1 hypothetical protein AVEN_174532-1 [Araneus ventricosus]GBN46406.1 hypothetical protein AVEN_211666-1 [Araneus ventricosus]
MVRLYDTKERRVVKEICTESSSSNNQRVLCICCSPLGTNFVTSTSIGEGGQLCLWDMKTLTMEIGNSAAVPVLDIGGHNKPVNTVDWSAAMESSTCICGTVDGRVIVSTLLNQ